MTKQISSTATRANPTPLRILIINPNTTEAMTAALEPAVSSILTPASHFAVMYFTCPSNATSGVPSINSPEDAARSARACVPYLEAGDLLEKHDAFLVACYSKHPLVEFLRAKTAAGRRGKVTGIFEASVAASLAVVGPRGGNFGFGIVSTGAVWGEALAEAVEEFLGGKSSRFLGCETTGLNADELHRLDPAQVRDKMKAATKRVVATARRGRMMVGAVCLGCAGMVGLDEAVREALVEELGEEEGNEVGIVDGVKAGVGELVMLARGGF